MESEVDLMVDLNAEDDEGLGWSTVSDARDLAKIQPGTLLLAGNRYGRAVVRIVTVDTDGQVTSASCPAPQPRTAICWAVPWLRPVRGD